MLSRVQDKQVGSSQLFGRHTLVMMIWGQIKIGLSDLACARAVLLEFRKCNLVKYKTHGFRINIFLALPNPMNFIV